MIGLEEFISWVLIMLQSAFKHDPIQPSQQLYEENITIFTIFMHEKDWSLERD